MNEHQDYINLVKKLTSRPAKTEPYSEADTTKMLLKIIVALSACGLTLTAIATLLAPYL